MKHRRVTIDDPQSNYYSSGDTSSDSEDDLNLGASLSNAPHEWGGPPVEGTITVACITDCPTTTVHAGKCYKALIDSGAAILLLR